MHINMIGPVTDSTGYGVHFTNISKALSKYADVSVTARSRVDPSVTNDTKLMKLVSVPYKYGEPTICVWFPDAMHLFHGTPRIGFTVFESDRLNNMEMEHLCSLDKILVPSRWAEDIINKELSAHHPPVFVVGEGYDPDIFYPFNVDGKFKQIAEWKRPVIQNIGKWEKRKGHIELIKSLGEVASKGRQFTFVGLWDNMFQPEWHTNANYHLIQAGFTETSKGKFTLGNGIVIISQRIPLANDLALFINMCDFGIYPHHAEGWCLPLLETMACGKPVIATNYSGPSEYLTEDVGLLLEPGELEPIYDRTFFPNGRLGNWRSVKQEELTDSIYAMIDIGEPGMKEMGLAALEQAQHFTWDKSAQRIIKSLE